MNIEENSNEEVKSSPNASDVSSAEADNHAKAEVLPSTQEDEPAVADAFSAAETVNPQSEDNPSDFEDLELDTNLGDSRRAELKFAVKSIVVGLLIGVIVAGVGYLKTSSSQHSFASQLIEVDTCGDASSVPSGFCFNSPVSVAFSPSNPLSQFLGTTSHANVTAAKARLGIFGDSTVALDISKLSGAAIGKNSPLSKTKAGTISGTISLAYAALTNTLRSSSSTSASIFYAGKNEIGTTNEVSYQGQNIALTVTSKISLKNNSLYLSPITVSALGHSAPASSIFSSTAPVPVDIPTLPKGMKYSSIETTKNYLIFHVVGSDVSLQSIFNSK